MGSTELSLELKKAYEKFSINNQQNSLLIITRLFDTKIEKIKDIYSQYCASYWNAENLRKTHLNFMVIVDQQMTVSCPDVKANINWQLIKPVQRVMKYPLFMNQLIRTLKMHTSLDTKKDDLEQAAKELRLGLRHMTDAIDYINESKRRKELAAKYRRPD